MDNDVEAWAVVVEDVLDLVPSDKRAVVLAAVVAKAEKDAAEAGANPLGIHDAGDFDWENSPAIRYWHDAMELRSVVVQVFTRRIRNNNSPENAARILFNEHIRGSRKGRGSGWLPHYLDGLPAVTIDLNWAAEIADGRSASF
jgi:hypothetical protein